jgi:hypothetical protein
MIASASFASSPASFSAQFAFLLHHLADQRLVGVERPRGPADRRFEHRHMRSSLIAEASAWPESGETSILRMRARPRL